jgi:hypothetical protein
MAVRVPTLTWQTPISTETVQAVATVDEDNVLSNNTEHIDLYEVVVSLFSNSAELDQFITDMIALD